MHTLSIKKLFLTALITCAVSSHAVAESVKVLAYGDSNTWGWIPTAEGYPTERYADHVRWSGVLEKTLDSGSSVITNGLVGRTTDLDADNAVGTVAGVDFNGKRSLAQAVASSMPLDWVVIMLGTNDLQVSHQRKPADIAKAVLDMAKDVQGMNMPLYSTYPAPKVLVVAPPALGDTSDTPLSGLFSVGEKSSTKLGSDFRKLLSQNDAITWIDAGQVIKTDGVDGIHLSARAHEALGKAIGNAIQSSQH